MDEFPMVDVLNVRALDGYRLWLRFSDGYEGERDLGDFISEGGPMVEPLNLKAPQFLRVCSWKWGLRPGRMAWTSTPSIST